MVSVYRHVLRGILLMQTEIVWHVLPIALAALLTFAIIAMLVILWLGQQEHA